MILHSVHMCLKLSNHLKHKTKIPNNEAVNVSKSASSETSQLVRRSKYQLLSDMWCVGYA